MVSFGAHDDVLKASPETREEKVRLIEEIKERAKHAFKMKDMVSCEKLYSKAIEISDESAILYANRSAVRLTVGNLDEAISDATKATERDPSYPKGWYRLGQGLERSEKFEEARSAYQRGKDLEPQSKLWVGALEKLAKAQADWKPPSPKKEIPIEKYEISSRLKASMEASKSSSKSQSDEFRGYKLDSQGRRTTFFNNELDDKTKELIGDIAPKKIERAVDMRVAQGASSWNQAGTFEEVNHTKYARDSLKRKLKELMVDLPKTEVGLERYLTVTSVNDFKGDASTTMMRGKKKYLLDVSFSIDWEFPLEGNVKAKGSATFPDVTTDAVVANDPLDILINVDSLTPDYARQIIDSHVKAEQVGLRPAMLALCHDFLDEFKKDK